jgi:hypothetical protein
MKAGKRSAPVPFSSQERSNGKHTIHKIYMDHFSHLVEVVSGAENILNGIG